MKNNYCDCRQGRDPCTCKPVPPARGEVEVLPQRKTGWPALSNHRSYNDGFNKACDEWMPHVTRLQAEIEEIRNSMAFRTSLIGRTTAERDALQSELTKARELLTEWLGSNFAGPYPARNDLRCRTNYVLAHQPAPAAKDNDWHMNPCKQGHRDIGAAGGIAHCYQCDEKIEAATTKEAFERWNATHPKP